MPIPSRVRRVPAVSRLSSAACLGALGMLIFACASAGAQARAAPAPPSVLNRAVEINSPNVTFADALKLLTKQYGLNFLADGSPALQRADWKARGTLRAALDDLADTFDYTWQPMPSGVILMSKRFHSPDEAPQAHLPELRQAAREIMALFAPFDFDRSGSWWLAVDALTASFTPVQMQALRDGVPLPYAALSDPQRRLLQSGISTNAFEFTYKRWEEAEKAYNGLSAGSWLVVKRYATPSNWEASVMHKDRRSYLFYMHAFTIGFNDEILHSVFKPKTDASEQQ